MKLRIINNYFLSLVTEARSEEWLLHYPCLLYTSDAADERSSVDLGGRRIIKKKTSHKVAEPLVEHI